MCKRLIVVLVLLGLMSSCGFQNRKGYYYDNQRFNFVRVEKLKDAKDKNINHPYQFTEPQISTILKMIEIRKGTAFSSNEKEKSVFDSYSIGKLTPAIVKAFSEINSDEKVGLGFMVKAPYIVIQNDRLTIGSMWVEDGKLHINFEMLYARMSGDTNKRGYNAMRRQAQMAVGLRTTLDPQPGQAFGDSTKELVVDLGIASELTAERLKKEADLAAKGVETDVKIKVIKDTSAKERLRELKTLRKERMITKEEFELKKKEILNQL